MSNEKSEYGRLVWTGLRQMQALRDAVIECLGGLLAAELEPSKNKERTKAPVATWLKSQGLSTALADNTTLPLVGIIGASTLLCREELLGSDALRAHTHGTRTGHESPRDYGADRSGAGWGNAPNFCITSAFLRLLGSWEQFELDVLKSLYYYRPPGKSQGPKTEQILIEPELEVVYEEPVADSKHPDKLNYSFPPEWPNVKKRAENNNNRASIFKNEYQIVAVHGAPDDAQLTANRKLSTNWYASRNAIAHGRKKVTMTLAEYLEVEVFVYRAMVHVSKQCVEKHMLLV